MAAKRAPASSAAVSQIRASVVRSPWPVPTEHIASSSCGTRAVFSTDRPSRLLAARVTASRGPSGSGTFISQSVVTPI